LELTHNNHPAATAFVKMVQKGCLFTKRHPSSNCGMAPSPPRRNGLNPAINITRGNLANLRVTKNTSNNNQMRFFFRRKFAETLWLRHVLETSHQFLIRC
jgi:hypothetical protein